MSTTTFGFLSKSDKDFIDSIPNNYVKSINYVEDGIEYRNGSGTLVNKLYVMESLLDPQLTFTVDENSTGSVNDNTITVSYISTRQGAETTTVTLLIHHSNTELLEEGLLSGLSFTAFKPSSYDLCFTYNVDTTNNVIKLTIGYGYTHVSGEEHGLFIDLAGTNRYKSARLKLIVYCNYEDRLVE